VNLRLKRGNFVFVSAVDLFCTTRFLSMYFVSAFYLHQDCLAQSDLSSGIL